MKGRIIVLIPVLALASYFSGFMFGPSQQAGTVAGTTTTPTPLPEKEHVTDCYTFTVPQGYEAPYGDPAKCELITKQPGGSTYISINRQPAADPANYTTVAAVRKKTTLPNCSAPAITVPEHGMIKSVFNCTGQTNQYYYFAPKGSRLGNLPGVPGKSLFYYVVDAGNNPKLNGDELLHRLKPND
ncbi:MAG: hypothetical protein K0S68_1012 [Candidatus Saccharibacteria bacterium]|nr:hypothetical protein [Candidatus Saccharibacteria bacterium]